MPKFIQLGEDFYNLEQIRKITFHKLLSGNYEIKVKLIACVPSHSDWTDFCSKYNETKTYTGSTESVLEIQKQLLN